LVEPNWGDSYGGEKLVKELSRRVAVLFQFPEAGFCECVPEKWRWNRDLHLKAKNRQKDRGPQSDGADFDSFISGTIYASAGTASGSGASVLIMSADYPV
jgi:hypothetical protein